VGTASWSYTFTPLATGAITIRTRAVDDSCNLETPSAGRTLNGGARTYPCSIWPAATVPVQPAENDATAIEVGCKFRSSLDGFITGVRFYKGAGNTGTHVGHLWTTGGQLLATATFSNETATGWQQASFPAPVAISAGVAYVVSYFAPAGHYAADAGYFNSAFDLAPLRALASGESGPNGVYRYGSTGFPTDTYGAANYWVDVVFNTNDNTAPTVVDRSPAPGIIAVATSARPAATFSEAMTAGSIVMQLRDAANNVIAGTVAYDAPTRTASFAPTTALALDTTYTASVISARDASNQAMAAATSWTFRTTTAVGAYPATLWDSAAVPVQPTAGDPSPIEVGTKFTCDIDGLVTGIRFYKGPGNTGTHTGHLWSAAGALLGTVSFSAESGAGWQQANLATPVPISRNTTYVVSYFTTTGNYAATANYFAANYDRGPLHAPAGANSVYHYGAGGGFPTDSWSSTNYWVDVVVTPQADAAAPSVSDYAPAPGLQAVALDTALRAVFSEAVNPATVNFVLRGPGNVVVPATLAYTAATLTATLTPNAALATATVYSATLSASDTSGNAMTSPLTWTFTTVSAAGQTPATIWDSSTVPALAAANDPASVEVGVKFRSDFDGRITGLRFYKGAGNTGTHVGHLWTTGGTLLGSVAFANEPATGWQQANFASPIAITAGTTYVASYLAPNGHYAVGAGDFGSTGVDRPPLHARANGADGGNGVYAYGAGSYPGNTYGSSNYFVDVVFVDTAGPAVTGRTPAPGATGVAATTTVTASFSEAIQPATLTFALRDGQGAIVASSVTYSAATLTATLTPTSALGSLKAYTASVSGARDLAGNLMSGAVSWSFTTEETGLYSLFAPSAVPSQASASDPGPLELGVKFRSDVAGTVRGIRFYKGSANTGTHVGKLWSSTGTLLASVSFSGESASGWQYAAFSAPVAIAANTTYVASYYAPNGGYATTPSYFNAGEIVSGPLHGLANVAGNGNGLYLYASGGGFPTGTYAGANYWVDVLFSPGT
jgi:hypothetical protein